MLSKLLPNILQKLLSGYIENVDTLSIPFWKGEIVLENLKLKKEAFDSELPFELVSGVIQKVVINIPLLRFFSDKITVNVDGVFLLFGRKDIASAAATEKPSRVGVTVDDLAQIQRTLESASSVGAGALNGGGGETIWFKMLKSLIKCLLLRVTNVHVCYQDQKTSPGERFSVGMTVESFNFESTNELWVPLSSNSSYNTTEAFKLGSIFNFSLYWNSQFGLTKLVKPEDMEVVLMHSIPRQRIKMDHKYIIQPFSGFIKICIKDEEKEVVTNDGVIKRLLTNADVMIGLKQIDVHLTDTQYRDMLNLLFFLHDWRKVLKYKQYRPHVPVKGHASVWWKFAYQAILSDLKKQKDEQSWSAIEESKNIRNCYVKIYSEKLLHRRITKVEENILIEIEKILTYEDVILFRNIAQRKVEDIKKKEVDNTLAETEGWWISGWFGIKNLGIGRGYNTGDKFILNSDELHFIDKVLKLDLSALAGGTPKNFITFTFKSNIKKACIQILDWRDDGITVPLAAIEATELDFSVDYQGYGNSRFDLDIESFDILDKCSKNSKFENIIVEKRGFDAPTSTFHSIYQGNGNGGNEMEKLLRLTFWSRPPMTDTDWQMKFKLLPFYLIYSKPFVDTMFSFFTHASQEALDTLKYSFFNKLKILQEKIMVELRHLVRNQKSADLDFDVSVPTIVFPESIDKEDTLMLVINPGNIILKSQPLDREWDCKALIEMIEDDEESERFTKAKQLLEERVQWWRDNCPIHFVDTPLDLNQFFSRTQIHKQTVEHLHHAKKSPFQMPVDTMDPEQKTKRFHLEEWDIEGLNINNAQFYEGVTFQATNVFVKICRFTQLMNFKYIVNPTNFQTFLQLCSDPFNLNIPQVICHSLLSDIKVEMTDNDIYNISKIVGKNGILDYFIDMESKSQKELSEMYDVVSISKPKSKSTLDLKLSVISDTKSILHARKKTKEMLTQCVLLKFFFKTANIEVKLNYERTESMVVTISNIRCKSLAKFLHMEVLMDMDHFDITDSNSLIPVISIFPHPHGLQKNKYKGKDSSSSSSGSSSSSSRSFGSDDLRPTDGVATHPVIIHLISISKNSLEYDYIDFVASLTTQCVRVNLPKECIKSLLKIVGKSISDANRFHEKKKSILTIEGSRYHSITDTQHTKHKHKKISEKLDANEFDPNDLKTKIVLNVPYFSLILCSRDNDLTSFHFDNVHIVGVFQLPLYDCTLSVGDMKFMDLTNEKGIHQNMLEALPNHSKNVPIVKMHVVSHNISKAKEWGYNRVIAIAIGKVKLTLLLQTINTIRHYLDDIDRCMKSNFPTLYVVQENVDENTNGTPTTKAITDPNDPNTTVIVTENYPFNSPNQEVIFRRKTITNLDITIDSNQLVLPKNPRSTDCLVLGVDRIALWLDQTDPTADIVHIKIQDVNIGTTKGSESVVQPIVMKPMKIDCTVIKKFETSLSTQILKMSINIEDIMLKMTQYQYNLLYNVIMQNINQRVVPPPVSPVYTKERLNMIFQLTLNILSTMELNLIDEKLPLELENLLSLDLKEPVIQLDYYNNGDIEIGINGSALSINNKNIQIDGKSQEIMSVQPDDTFKGKFPIMSLEMVNGVTSIEIFMDRLIFFLDLTWVDKLALFMVPLADPDNISYPIENVAPGEWDPLMSLKIIVKQADLMIGSFTDPNSIILLMTAEVNIDIQSGTDGLIKILLGYTCNRGLLSSPQAASDANKKPHVRFVGQRHTCYDRWNRLKNTSKLFLEAFETTLCICLVSEGNQFYFCELDKMIIVFSGRAYRFLLDIYETVQNILYNRSNKGGSSASGSNQPPEIEVDSPPGSPNPLLISPLGTPPVLSPSLRAGSTGSPFLTGSPNPLLPIPQHTRTLLYAPSPSSSPMKFNQLYQLKTRSAEMIRRHQSKMNRKQIATSVNNSGNAVATTIQKKPFTQFSFCLKNIEVLVVDDLSPNQMNSPLFKFKLSYGFMKMMIKSKMEIEFDSVICLDYFNNRIAFWEPFLEPWQLKVNMLFSKELSFEMFSKDLLNLNITLPLMDNVSLFLMTYSQEFGYPFNMIAKPPMKSDEVDKDHSPNNVQKKSLTGRIRKLQSRNKVTYAPFFVRNQTGSKIRYRLETHDGKPVEGVQYDQVDGRRVVNIDNYGIFFDLYPGDSMPVKFNQDIQIHLDTFNQLVISIELLGVEKSIVAPLDKIKTYEYPVVLDSTSSTTLLVTVGIKSGTKFITIRFPVVFQNLTRFPIDVATVITGYGIQQPPNLSAIIREQQTKSPVPVHRMKNALMKLKPSGDVYKWSTETLNINELNSTTVFTSQSVAEDKTIMIKCYLKEKNGCSIIKLCPMVKVKNLLPYPIIYRLKSKYNNNPYQIEKALEPETKEEVYDIPIIDKFKVQAMMNDIWTDEKQISETDNIQIIDILGIEINNQHLHFNIEYDSEGGMRKLVFYNQYWIFNKSGLNIFCKKPYKSRDHYEGSVSLNHIPIQSKDQPIAVSPYEWYDHHRKKVDPIMFSYRKTKDIENSIHLRVGDSEWSNKISITAIGDRGMVNVYSGKGHGRSHGGGSQRYIYILGVSIDVTPNLKTKIIVLAPRYVFFNQYPYDLIYKQVNTDYEIRVGKNEKIPLYFLIDNKKEEHNFVVRMDHPGSTWSSPFSILTIQDYSFQLYSPNDEKARELNIEPFIKVQTTLEAATIFIISTEMKEPPYKISNMTKFPMVVQQRKVGAPIHIQPREIVSYTWDQPLAERVLEVNVMSDQNTHKMSIKVDKIKEFKPLEFQHRGMNMVVKAIVEPEESTRVLKLTDSTYRISKVEEEETSKQFFRMNFVGVGVSLINANPTEILYVTVNEIVMEYYYSNFIQSLEMRIESMQVDNQLSKVTPFSHPVLLFSEKNSKHQYFLLFKMIKSNKFKNIDYFHHVSLDMQEMNIKLEERFLYVLLDFFNSLDFSFWTGRKKTKMALQHVDVLKPIYSGDIGDGFIDEMLERALPSIYGKKMYFEDLSIEPISMYLTFDLSKQSGSFQSLEAPMVRAFRRIGFVLVSFQQAHIFLNSFKFTHAFGTNDELLNPLFRHYLTEGLSEVYKILGTFNFLGNPIGLFKNFGVGFKEFFVNTGRGIVGSNFRTGVSTGTKSLAKHSVYGLFDSGTKLNLSAAKALSSLSMDQQYILERQYITAEVPSNVIQGLSLGGRIFLISCQRSFTGIVRLPYYGGKEGGVLGALKGIGKGTAGLVLKPAAGGFDFLSKTSEGIKNSTHLNMERKRMRYPRPLFSDMPLKVYSEAEAYGQFLFITNLISSGRLKRLTPDQINMPLLEMVSKDERYVSHIIYKNSKTLLFTNKRIVYLKDTDGFRKKFDVKYTSVLSVVEQQNAIRVKISQAHKFRVLNPRKRKSYFIKCQGEAKHYIYNKLVEHLSAYTPFSNEDPTAIASDQIPTMPVVEVEKCYDNVTRTTTTSRVPPPPPPPLPAYGGSTNARYAPPGTDPSKMEFRTVKPGEQLIQPIIVQGARDGKVDATLEYLLDQPHRHNIAQPIWISRGPPPHDQLDQFQRRSHLDIPPVLYQRDGPPMLTQQPYVSAPAYAPTNMVPTNIAPSIGPPLPMIGSATQYSYPNPQTVSIITSQPNVPVPMQSSQTFPPALNYSTTVGNIGPTPPPPPPPPQIPPTPPALPNLYPPTPPPLPPPTPIPIQQQTPSIRMSTSTPGTTRLTRSQYRLPTLKKTTTIVAPRENHTRFRTPLHSLYSNDGSNNQQIGKSTTTTTTTTKSKEQPGYESDYLKQAKHNQMTRQIQTQRANQHNYQKQVEQSVDNMMKIQQMQIQQMHQLQQNQLELQNLIFQQLTNSIPQQPLPALSSTTSIPAAPLPVKEETTTTTTVVNNDTQGAASK